MQPHLQGVEIETPRRGDHDLAVHHAALGQPLQQRLVQLREITVQRLEVAALNVEVGGAAKDDRAEAVPLGLEEKVAVGRQVLRQRGEHRRDRGREGEVGSHGQALSSISSDSVVSETVPSLTVPPTPEYSSTSSVPSGGHPNTGIALAPTP